MRKILSLAKKGLFYLVKVVNNHLFICSLKVPLRYYVVYLVIKITFLLIYFVGSLQPQLSENGTFYCVASLTFGGYDYAVLYNRDSTVTVSERNSNTALNHDTDTSRFSCLVRFCVSRVSYFFIITCTCEFLSL